MTERSIVPVLKTGDCKRSVGSNPTPSSMYIEFDKPHPPSRAVMTRDKLITLQWKRIRSMKEGVSSKEQQKWLRLYFEARKEYEQDLNKHD